MSATPESQARTRAFARVIGPWLVIAPGIIALRAPGMGALASEFFRSDLAVWFTGAALLFGGLSIIAFHQYWSSLAAILISAFGWILALRGLALMAAPGLYERAALPMDTLPLVRLIFGVFVAIGLYLAYVGWLAKPASPAARTNAERAGTSERFLSNATRTQTAVAEGGIQPGSATPESLAHSAISRSCNSTEAACGSGARSRRWWKYLPVTRAGASSLTASHAWVRRPWSGSSGALAPPMRVATQPGSTRVRQHARPAARDGEGDQHVAQLAVGIGRGAVPGAPSPGEIVEIGARAAVHAGTQIDEAIRPLDQRRQDIGREDIDGEDLRQSVFRHEAPPP